MRLLLIGSGAREHAIARHLTADGVDLFVAPGNPGTAELATNFPLEPTDPAAVAALAARLAPDLVVIGPEAPLVAGVADRLIADGHACFGPPAAAARIEGSKAFAKQVMSRAGVRTARAATFTGIEVGAGLSHLRGSEPPFVVKYDGLAAGKGVTVTEDLAAAEEALRTALGAPADRAVVEEFLDGPEVSLFAVCDGTNALPLIPAQDFKRLADGDRGPNTGGMGAYAPLPWAPAELAERVAAEVITPVLRELARRGCPFRGLLYAGLALTEAGPAVVEFNARFGDPETQSVLALLASPLAPLLVAAASGELSGAPALLWRPGAAVTVVIAAPGYPAAPRTGGVIGGLAAAASVPGVNIFHAATACRDGALVSAGGRVLSITATGDSLSEARERAYQAAEKVELEGAQLRRDVALAASTGAAGW